MCNFELLINSLNLAKIIDDNKTLFPIVSKSTKSSSSKIIDGSKTPYKPLNLGSMLSSSKNPYGSKTQ